MGELTINTWCCGEYEEEFYTDVDGVKPWFCPRCKSTSLKNYQKPFSFTVK